MNPLTNVKNITKLNETELASGSIHKKSWHDMYKDSAWIFVGGLQYDLTEGDILAVFSQYGEIVNINLVRDKKSGKSKGFCFLCYSNQKSTVLAVDNFNGIKLCNRTIRVDHVSNYKPPKEDDRDDEITKTLKSEGCAPKPMQTNDSSSDHPQIKKKKSKKEKKEKKKKKKKTKAEMSDSEKETSDVAVKKEKHDPGYDKYDTSSDKISHAVKIKREESSSRGESFQRHEMHRPKVDRLYHKTQERSYSQHENENNRKDEDRVFKKSKYRTESSDRQRPYKDTVEHRSSPRPRKRKMSNSSSENTSRDHIDTVRYKSGRDHEKNRHSVDKRKSKDVKRHSSSSSDEDSDSSTQSSSDDERIKDKKKYSKKDKYRTYDEKVTYEEEARHKHYYTNDDANYMSSKSKYYDKAEKIRDHSSYKSKYRNEDSDDSDYKNSRNYKSQYHKR